MDKLWEKRASLLKSISRLLGISDSNPLFVLKHAKKSINNGLDPKRAEVLRALMKELREVREEIFKQMREKFSKMFERAFYRFGEEGVSILTEKLLFCIDHCRVGLEDSFPAYFMRYVKRAFSEMEDERMACGFHIPRRDKLLLRKKSENKELIPLIREEVDLADHTTAEDVILAREEKAIAREREMQQQQKQEDLAWWQLPLRKV